MEVVVALLEIIAMAFLLAVAIWGACFMGVVIYFGLKSRKEFDKEFEDDK